MLFFVIACGVLAVLYGVFTSRAVLASSPGSERMQQIAAAIQEGAAAYLNRQYTTIAIAGIVIAIVLFVLLTWQVAVGFIRSEEHTSELQSLMRISYAVFCLKKKKTRTHKSKQE